MTRVSIYSGIEDLACSISISYRVVNSCLWYIESENEIPTPPIAFVISPIHVIYGARPESDRHLKTR